MWSRLCMTRRRREYARPVMKTQQPTDERQVREINQDEGTRGEQMREIHSTAIQRCAAIRYRGTVSVVPRRRTR